MLYTIGMTHSLSINLITNIIATVDGTQQTRCTGPSVLTQDVLTWSLVYTPQAWDSRSQHHTQLYFYLVLFFDELPY